MKIYIVAEWVDLGYHIVSAHKSKQIADIACASLNTKYNEDRFKLYGCAPRELYLVEEVILGE